MIGGLLKRFLDEHETAILQPISKNSHTDIITSDLPREARDVLKLTDEYKIYGSCGAGQWAETPWVAILNRAITESTQNGYYMCYLLDPQMKTVHLCLAVGWTQFSDQFSDREARTKIEQYSSFLVNRLHDVPTSFRRGPIDLTAKRSLSKGYEAGQILSRMYAYEDLVNEESLVTDLQDMIKLYDALSLVAGDSILNIDYADVSESSEPTSIDKSINAATLRSDTERAILDLISLADAEPPKYRKVIMNKIIRKPKFAIFVKDRSDYICQICGREPFFQKNGKPYAEADHIESLGAKGPDHPDNMRCLCAQCHAVVTHGSDDELAKLIDMAKQ